MLEDPTSRRSFVFTTSLAAATLAAPGSAAARRSRRTRRPREPFVRGGEFAHGVSAGQPAPRAITLWTRVDGIERSGRIGLEVARDPGFRRIVDRRQVRAAAIRDYTARLRLRTRRLRPDEVYYYRFFTNGATSRVGRFKTALPVDSGRPVRIGFFSCQRYTRGYYTAHAGLAAEEDLDAVVCLGDYIYETGGPGVAAGPDVPSERDDRTGGDNGQVETLAEYRAKYQLYRSDPDLQEMHASHAFLPVWDDHEVENNWAGEHKGTTNDSIRTMSYEERKRRAFLGFFEYMPIERVPSNPDRIYRRLRLGANADLIVLDTRQYRDPQPCDDRPGPCLENDDPNRTKLGARQREWLGAALEASRATWKIVGTQTMMMSLDAPIGFGINPDQWDGYAAERRAILERAVAAGVQNIAFVAGDIHTFFAGDVSTTGRIGGRPAATEFVGGSITSESLDVVGPVLTPVLTAGVRAMNPHMSFADFERRGYGVLTASRDELRVDFRSPESVLTPTSPVRTIASFRVPNGTPRVDRL